MPEENEDEAFRVLPRDERYRVSRDGRVQSVCSGVWEDLAQTPHVAGYRLVGVGTGGRNKQLVHRLVLEAWVGPCPPGHEVRHLNDVPDDNRLENIRWGTRAENIADSVRNGRRSPGGERHPAAWLTDAEVLAILARVRAGEPQSSIALAFGCSQSNVSGIATGVIRTDVTGLPRRSKGSFRPSRVA